MSPQVIAVLAGVSLAEIEAEIARQRFPDVWTIPEAWAPAIWRRLGEAAARIGSYDPDAAAAWHRAQSDAAVSA
jgi:hypothetical protein